MLNIVNYYNDSTPQRTKLLDAFMAFLVVVGALTPLLRPGWQLGESRNVSSLVWPRPLCEFSFANGSHSTMQPFNAFLSGFSATVGQFVLTGKLPSAIHPMTQSHQSG